MKRLSSFKKIFPTLAFTILFILGGLGKIESYYLVLLSIFFISLKFFVSGIKSIKLPPLFTIFLLAMFIFTLSLFWSFDSLLTFRCLTFFWVGGFFWVYFYNHDEIFENSLAKPLIFSSVFFVILFIYLSLVGGLGVDGLSLFNSTSVNMNHNHLGDFIAVISIYSLYKFLYSERKILWLTVALISFVFVAFSMSRAAYFSLGFGIFYLLSFLKRGSSAKLIINLFLIGSIVFIFISGTQKSLILNRQYYLQSIVGVFNEPFGVGVGNFKYISENPENHVFGLNGFSTYAEGIVFEFLSGLGVLGIVFIYWFIKAFVSVIFDKTEKPVPEIVMFAVLSINFLFDYTYFIPTMLWLWFMLLGLSQKTLFQKGEKVA